VPASSNRNMAVDADSNLTATLRLLEICVREKVHRIVFSSSGGTVYGRTSDDPISESHTTEPLCSYGIVKLAIEKYLELFRIQHGLDYTVLRISNCYGPRLPIKGEQGVVGVFLDRLRRREPIELWGDGSITRDYVYVTDVAGAFHAALGQQSPFRMFNIGTGIGTSLVSLIAIMEHVTGRRARIAKQQGRIVDVPANVLDPTRARKYLSWQANTPLERGLLNTWNWMQAGAQVSSAHTP
jgi:UDP-glucose 4-epimerase